jgi:hypothetical protein
VRTFRGNVQDPTPVNYCNAGVPGVKWRPVSLYCYFSVSTPFALLVGSVRSLEVLDKGAQSRIRTDRRKENTIVLESLSRMFSAQFGLISASEQGKC